MPVSGRAPVVWLQLVLLDGAHPAKPEKLGAKDLKITGSQKGSKRYLFLKKIDLNFQDFHLACSLFNSTRSIETKDVACQSSISFGTRDFRFKSALRIQIESG